MKPFSLSAAWLAVFGLLVLPGCNTGVAETTDASIESAALPVDVVHAERRDIEATFASTATLVADSEAPVPARSDGVVVELLVEEGDRVERGQVLARLDGARAMLEKQRAKADLERLTRELERFENLHARGLVSSAAFDAASYDVAAGQAAFDLAALAYEYTHIRATIDGVVSSRSVKLGRTLAEGEVAFTVTNLAELVAYLDVPQIELSNFSVGQSAGVSVDSQPGSAFRAEILRLSPTIDRQTGTFRATVAIDNRAGALAPGMFGRFDIALRTHPGVLVLPESAVVSEDTETTVFVIENGTAIRRAVATGIRAGGFVEITDGLQTDERVVLRGQSRLRDGTPVLAEAGATVARNGRG